MSIDLIRSQNIKIYNFAARKLEFSKNRILVIAIINFLDFIVEGSRVKPILGEIRLVLQIECHRKNRGTLEQLEGQRTGNINNKDGAMELFRPGRKGLW